MDRTDWDSYYSKPYKTATFSRKITCGRLIQAMEFGLQKTQGSTKGFEIAELGGANSCFFTQIVSALEPKRYHLVDNNELGLKKFTERLGARSDVELHHGDVLNLKPTFQADMVFSVGLIEHFSEQDTAKAIAAHFALTKPGGIVLMTFPTPTFLYRITRGLSEALGMWIFHDERPLRFHEVEKGTAPHGEALHSEIIWPIFLTQGLIVLRKNGEQSTH